MHLNRGLLAAVMICGLALPARAQTMPTVTVTGQIPFLYNTNAFATPSLAQPDYFVTPTFGLSVSGPLWSGATYALQMLTYTEIYKEFHTLNYNQLAPGIVVTQALGDWRLSASYFAKGLFTIGFEHEFDKLNDFTVRLARSFELTKAWSIDGSANVTRRIGGPPNSGGIENQVMLGLSVGPTWTEATWSVSVVPRVQYSFYDMGAGTPAPRDLFLGLDFETRYTISKVWSLSLLLSAGMRQSNLPTREYRQLTVGPAIGFTYTF